MGHSPCLAGVILGPESVAVTTLQYGEGAPLPLLLGLGLLHHGRRVHHMVHEALAPPLWPRRGSPRCPWGRHQFGAKPRVGGASGAVMM